MERIERTQVEFYFGEESLAFIPVHHLLLKFEFCYEGLCVLPVKFSIVASSLFTHFQELVHISTEPIAQTCSLIINNLARFYGR